MPVEEIGPREHLRWFGYVLLPGALPPEQEALGEFAATYDGAEEPLTLDCVPFWAKGVRE